MEIFQIYPIDANEVETELPPHLADLPAELRLDNFEKLDFTDLVQFFKEIVRWRLKNKFQ